MEALTDMRPGIYTSPSDPDAFYVNTFPGEIRAGEDAPFVARLPKAGWTKAQATDDDLYTELPADAVYSDEPRGAARARLMGRVLRLYHGPEEPREPVTLYTTRGPVRGGCGHRHRSYEAAERCLAADQRACASLGGGSYSDRAIVRVS